ncbi:aldo/keto reductase [Cellulomonas cellasea]|uniref:Aryl-alcohol dehydrogenase-like predicted oxidoreductase n=1 Tax=Cellulomonas cellasea TaxID=43670 RepID=A0A7W4YDL3_9CELL|nr:aldo/keto reductase [Cellulomonas cellasea]MBB2924686.1 aryl-alcohol dehydrogenase-like predicted oxidoreductase [Cellulomonas cellasea]
MTTLRRRLGRSGLDTSALGLGCWALGGRMASGDQPLGYAGVDEDEATRALHRGIELGVTLLDTADAYGAGRSEELLAPVLAAHPDVLVATKFGNTIDPATRQLTGVDVSPGYVREALHASLRRLGRDHVDVYQLHTPTAGAAVAEELAATLEALVDEGLVRWWGVSTDDPDEVEVLAHAPHLAVVQIQLNVLDDNAPMLALAERHDLGVLVRSPLAMGLLGGRYTAASRLPADDVRGREPEWMRWFSGGSPAPEMLERLDAVREALTADGRTLAQGALGWIWAHDERAVPLPGFRDVRQVEENVGALAAGPLDAAVHGEIELLLGRGSG